MNSSQFMDKQITGLAGGSGSGGRELFDLKEEEIVPSYDFQPIRTVGSSSSAVSNSNGTNPDAAAKRSWGSADSKICSASLKYSNILEPHEPPKVRQDKERDAYDVATVTEIDRTVKKCADNLLHTLEGVSSRLVQLESRTRHLENSIDELKDTIGNNSGSTDGKLRHLENILREVQTGVQVLRDKQEIADTQLQLTKLQQTSFKTKHHHPPPESSNATAAQPDSLSLPQPPPPPPQPSYQPPTPAPLAPPPLPPPQQPPPPTLPSPNAPPPPQFSQPQLTSFPSLPREPSYFPQPGAPPMQPQPQSQPPPPQLQHYQLPQHPQQMPPPQPLHSEEPAPYMPPPPPPPQSQAYPPSIRQPIPLSQPPPSSAHPQFYGSSQLPPFPSNYGPTDGCYPYGSASPLHYNRSTMKQPLLFTNSPPLSSNSDSGNYSHLPTAKILPQPVPAGQGSGGGGRVPIDDMVDKVATMGFSREQVRATVRKLTENGQSVDLNVVLDKLMNDGGGEMIQPQKGWFGR